MTTTRIRGKARNEVTLDAQGRVLIPAEIRHAKGWEPGERLWVRVVKGRLMILTPDEALDLAQELFMEGLPPGGPSMVDELIAERRAAAARGD